MMEKGKYRERTERKFFAGGRQQADSNSGPLD